ncbi:hypothetical protein [Nocardioides sediminis]|uniref:hypothetical protein n=1 Tax=Nocardioides sediminis TaxID=433648 RepID=UPI000D31547F|nr:hypothetical protein [Nocardioides sediminis]
MPTRPDALLLWGRAGVLSGFTFLVGALGHVTGGGLLPGLPGLVLLLAVGTALAATFLTRPASARLLVSLVVGGQVLVHGALSLTAGHAGGHHTAPAPAPDAAPAPLPGALPTSNGGRIGSLQDHYEATVGVPAATGLTVPDPAALLEHAPMFLAHAAAGVLVGLWLAAGERAVWTLLALAVRTVLAPLVVLLPPTPTRRPRPAVVHRHPLHRSPLDRVARSVVRRGPPALLAA